MCGDVAVTDVHYLAVFLTPYLAGVDGSVYNDWIMNRRQPHPVVGKHGLACVNPSNVAIAGEICLEHCVCSFVVVHPDFLSLFCSAVRDGIYRELVLAAYVFFRFLV